MKIAMIGHKRVPSREGGVEIVVEELSTRLVKLGHSVDIYNRKGKNVQDKTADSEKKHIKEYKGTKILTIPTINKKGLDALIYSFFATIVSLFKKYDCIHYHAEGSCVMLPIQHLFKKRIVVTIHGLDWQRSKWGGFATKYIKFGEKMAVKYADEIIVLSENVQKYFKETYNRETKFIPNGVNKPTIKEPNIIKEKYGLYKDSYILFLARIVPEKGLHYLIEAFNQLKTDKKLVVAGGASHTNDYLDTIKNEAEKNKNIIMTGFVQDKELQELYSNCYLYVLPSDVEGMPISLLEAMSYGKNCLVSNIEENTQVTEKYATSFEKGNVQDLKEKLEDCLNGKNRKDEEEISNYILEKYNWDDVVEKTEKLYKK
jgi:glycosyltransferase involved in cell wall biosynthesis